MPDTEEIAKGKQSALVEDFRKFRREPSADSRAALVGRICDLFNGSIYKEHEKQIVKEILDFLSRDLERNIRRVLAEKLKDNGDLPHEIAVRLAHDVEEVSTPILQFSKLLTDDDLEAVLSSSEELGKLVAIARREAISERISASLVGTENEEVVATLMDNQGAAVSEETLDRVVTVFRNSDNVLETLVRRGGLSGPLAEKMVNMVSAKLQYELTKQYKVSPRVAQESLSQMQEEVTLGTIARNLDRNTTIELVNHMHATGRLTQSIVLKALCQADLFFFEAGIGKLAGIPAANASTLISKGDHKGFASLYQAASMPATMMEATEVLLRLIQKDPPDAKGFTRAYAGRLISHITTAGYDRDIPGMHYFMTLINEGSGRPVTSLAAS